MDKLKFIKLIVFILTFLLVFGILVAAASIYKKTTRNKTLSDISLMQPAGSYIADYRVDNGNIYILVKGGKTADRIVIINQASQTVAATIKTY